MTNIPLHKLISQPLRRRLTNINATTINVLIRNTFHDKGIFPYHPRYIEPPMATLGANDPLIYFADSLPTNSKVVRDCILLYNIVQLMRSIKTKFNIKF